MFPVYEDTYERRVKFYLPNGALSSRLNVDHYKDDACSLDYLASRPDIDSNKLAYLGVSMGSAKGVIISTLLQDRLKTAIFLDGGYFLFPPRAGSDQADFAAPHEEAGTHGKRALRFLLPVGEVAESVFAMLGTPDQDKRHVVLDTPTMLPNSARSW